MASASVYHDLAGLGALRSQASKVPSEAIEEVAAQFESIFVQMMLKSMRDASIEGGLFDSSQMETYQSMFDQQISLDLSQGNGLGLADVLVQELRGHRAPKEQSDLLPLASSAYRQANQQTQAPSAAVQLATQATSPATTPAVTLAAAQVTPVAVKDSGDVASTEPQSADAAQWKPSSPEAFIRDVWDSAVDAAKQIGLDPLVLVAQSALETGWGKRVIQAVDGGSSFNLFGIKAGRNWDGPSAAVNSLEYRDGTAALEKSSFRVYDSISKSFEDYVNFLKSNPRYQQALDKVGDAGEFLGELQGAGYATDPNYAQKIMGIVGKASFGAVVNELKKF